MVDKTEHLIMEDRNGALDHGRQKRNTRSWNARTENLIMEVMADKNIVIT